MRFEVIKSYILAVLVGISLLLTFSLWNYQPNYDLLLETSYLDEIDLGGSQQTKKEIIVPDSTIFKRNDKFYGFTNPRDRQLFYQDVQSWVLYDYNTGDVDGPPKNDYQVEFIFPESLPISILPTLFTFSEEIGDLPNWNFQRMYITLVPNQTLLYVRFLSDDGEHFVSFTVNDDTKHDLVRSYIMNSSGMSEYMTFVDSDNPIYIPKNPVYVLKRSLSTEAIDPKLLVDALFPTPSSVRSNSVSHVNERYYADGQRGMTVYQDKRIIKYVNPFQANYEYIDAVDLLDRSITNINAHNGWTDEYKLEEIDLSANKVRYRLFYGGYPIYNVSDATIIEQQWPNQELYEYIRPLYSMNSVAGEQVEIESGTTVKSFLLNHSIYKVDNISDIQIGYRAQDTSSYILTLEPAWFMKYNGKWLEINMDEPKMDKEVS